MRTRVVAFAVAAATVLGAAPARAASCAGLPKHRNFPVVDAANVVPTEAEAWLIADLVRYHVSGHEAIVVATVPDLDGDDISAYAKRLFDCWGVGDDTTDNGVLVLVAMAERRVRIELGAGLDGTLTQKQLESAIADMRTPMRRGDVGAGVRAAVVSVVGALGNEFPDTRNGKDGSAGNVPVTVPTPAPGDVEDTPSGGLPPEIVRDIGSPFGGDEPGGGALGFVPILMVLGVVFSVGRALIGKLSGAMGGGRSSWAGFPGYGGGGGWVAPPAVFRNGSWHSPPDTGSGFGGSDFGSSSGSSDSGGSSGGSSGSFGGGSSGGGGASGTW